MSQPAYVYHLRLPATEWQPAMERVHKASSFSYLYGEEPANLHLIAYAPPLPAWPEGRAFGAAVEVRWSRRRDGEIELTLLTEQPFTGEDNWQPCSLQPGHEAAYTVEEGQSLLLGVSRRHPASPYPADPAAPKAWTDSRIPRNLEYPLAENQAGERWAKLKLKIYRVDGRPVLTRMVALEGTSHDRKI